MCFLRYIMKILHILYSGLGGHGNVFFSFIKADEEKHFEFEAIFAGVENIREEYITKSEASNVNWKFIHKKRGIDISFNKKIITTLKESKSSIIFLHGSRFIILAKIAALLSKKKKKIVVRETQANHLKTKAEWVWLGFAMLLADKIIFLTDNFKEEVSQKLGFLYLKNKVGVISNGMDLSFFKPIAKPTNQTIIIGMQSRIVPIKDHETLLNGLAIFHNLYPGIKLLLKIAGDGESLPALKILANQLQVEALIDFTGLLNETALINFMQSLDIYIHASLGETMSTAIMQAMACKLPIIASDVQGINNMIEKNKTGLLIPIKSPQAIAAALHFIITNPVKASQMRQAAYDYAFLNYSNITMFAKYKQVFNSLLNK